MLKYCASNVTLSAQPQPQAAMDGCNSPATGGQEASGTVAKECGTIRWWRNASNRRPTINERILEKFGPANDVQPQCYAITHTSGQLLLWHDYRALGIEIPSLVFSECLLVC